MARTISIVGAGRVGRTLGKRLRKLGWRIGAVVTRSAATSRAAVRAIGAGIPHASLTAIFSADLPGNGRAGLQPRRKRLTSQGALAPEASASSQFAKADVILLTTPDDALAGVVRVLAEVGGNDWRGKIALHTSGTLDRSVLAPLARLGAATGSIHPMQAFGGKIVPNLRGVIFTIEGDRPAQKTARSIAQSLGGVPVVIEGRDKPVYHAAAVMAAGSAYPTMEAGVQLLMRIGFSRARAMQTLVPLIRQIFDNIERIGPRAAWTGPLSRGDYDVVAAHAAALRRHPSEVQEAYAALAHLAARVLSKRPASATKRLKRALKKAKGGFR